jgi:purine-binding chemotaxis protein CheW
MQTLEKETKQEEIGKIVQLIVFRLAHQDYALNIEEVREIVITPPISKVPLTPDYIVGVANIRGNIFAMIDLLQRFKISTENVAHSSEKSFTLVLTSETLQMGLLVKEVPNTLEVAEKNIDLAPDLIADNTQEQKYVRGLVKYQNKIIILIDIMKLVSEDDFNAVKLKIEN